MLMSSAVVRFAVCTVATLVIAQAAAAQVPPGVGEGWAGEFDHASRQLLQLAEATPAENFGWHPAPGVRSIAEVYMHIAAANQFLLTQVGAKPSVDLTKMGSDPEKSIGDKAGRCRHMGQAITCARMNGVVPPWSAGRER